MRYAYIGKYNIC